MPRNGASPKSAEELKCPHCTFTSFYEFVFRRHNCHFQNGQKRFTCPDCSYSADQKGTLRRHAKAHAKDAPSFICGFCNIYFIAEGGLTQHNTQCHRQLYSCDYCDYKSSRRNQLREHVSRHTGDYNHFCAVCGEGFPSSSCLKNHELSHNETKLHHCEKCDFSTNYREQLKIHVLNHSGRKLRSCSDCEYQSNSKKRMSEHVYKHTSSEPPFKCQLCDYATYHSSELGRHARSRHLDPKTATHSCSICHTKFSNQVLLDEHINKKHGENSPSMKEVLAPFMKKHVQGKIQCQFCQAKFTDDQSFEDHVNSHTVAKS